MGTSTLWSSDISLTDQPISASRARAFVRLHLGEHLLSYLADDVEQVASELATNAMMHARTPFRVSLHAFEKTLLLEVEDGSQTGLIGVIAQPFDTGGRGVSIVKQLSRDWGLDACTGGGKSVWAEFGLRDQSQHRCQDATRVRDGSVCGRSVPLTPGVPRRTILVRTRPRWFGTDRTPSRAPLCRSTRGHTRRAR